MYMAATEISDLPENITLLVESLLRELPESDAGVITLTSMDVAFGRQDVVPPPKYSGTIDAGLQKIELHLDSS